MSQRQTLFLAPDLIGQPGGVARVCSLVCRALTETGEGIATISLHDREDASKIAVDRFPEMTYKPCNGGRVRFVLQAVVNAMRRPPAVIFAAHPYFSHITYLIARLVGARSVVMIHGTDAWYRLSSLRRWALKRVDVVISVSSFTAKQAALANGFSLDKVRVVHNCLDPELPMNPRANGKHPDLSLLTVGRIKTGESKGHDQVIKALPELLVRFPNLKYSVVGDGDGRHTLESLAEDEGVSDAVKFHGTVSEEDLMRHYAEASVFIMPSRGEGFGLTFVEAMALSKPAIGGNLDATPEVILDNETGYVVDPSSITQIVDRVSRLLSDEPLREQMGKRASTHVRKSFSYASFKKNLLQSLFDEETGQAAAK